jgi:hypothetical protein
LEEAADIFLDRGLHAEAGEVFAELGFAARAAKAFELAGDITRMEQMFALQEVEDSSDDAFSLAWDAYEFAVNAPDPIGVVEGLERCVALRPHDAGLSARLLTARERLPRSALLRLVAPAGDFLVIGGGTLCVGREADNEIVLADPGVSRSHCRVTRVGSGYALHDQESRFGTHLAGNPVEDSALLPERGEFGVGRIVRIAFDLTPGRPGRFEVTTGHSRGRLYLFGDGLTTAGMPPDEPAWLPAGLSLVFVRGYWHVDARASDGRVVVEGRSVEGTHLLLIGDEVVFAGVEFKVA